MSIDICTSLSTYLSIQLMKLWLVSPLFLFEFEPEYCYVIQQGSAKNMPELPEVEIQKRTLKNFEGKTVDSVEAEDERLFVDPLNISTVNKILMKKTIREIHRIGKYLIIDFEALNLLFSLRMTGQFYVQQNSEINNKGSSNLIIGFQGSPYKLLFRTIRRFSKIHLIEKDSLADHDKILKLGPDPLKSFSLKILKQQMKSRRGPIKSILMDQTFLAGLGNIYANEICFRASLDPRKVIPQLNHREKRKLFEFIPKVLQEAIAGKGSSISDFSDPDGETGQFQNYYRVYSRAGELCVDCGSSIHKINLSGRSTFFCEQCQV